MREEFKTWMIDEDRNTKNTANNHIKSIDKLSQHYSSKRGKDLNICQETDLVLLKDIKAEYGAGGTYFNYGNYNNGAVRDGIVKYVEFIKYKKSHSLDTPKEEKREEVKKVKKEKNIESNNSNAHNFTYESDLQNALINQVDRLFPDYKVYGDNDEGIGFSIEGQTIDLLLEDSGDNLLAVELDTGKADLGIFGQTFMYLGILSKRFPSKTIKGLIIAGEAEEELKNACLMTDQIELKTYSMQLSLDDIIQ